MDRSYKFAVIQARPDKMRGERVNVGIIVDGPSGPDIRMPEVRKLRHLTGHRWDDVAEAFAGSRLRSGGHDIFNSSIAGASEVFISAAPGTLRANTPEEYEKAVATMLRLYVEKPSLTKNEKQQKINSEISAVLRNRGVLGRRGDDIDEGKVIPQFVISEEKDIVADFAYRPNGLKVVSTLELRGLENASHSKACEKGATLYFAREKFGRGVKLLGVYAASPVEADSHRSEIEILRSFADGNAFNWMDANERGAFQAALY